MGAFSDTCRSKTLVYRQVNTGYFSTIHPLECDEVATFISNSYAHWHTDFFGLGPGSGNDCICLVYIETFYCQHLVFPSSA